MAREHSRQTEIKTWLTVLLREENLKSLSVNISGTSESGDGYMSDVVFVRVSGSNENTSIKEYDLVLKCNDRNSALRQDQRFIDLFINEMYVYNKLIPMFIQFQNDQGVDTVFNNVPKCYGSLAQENMELIALQNLKSIGYELWPRKQPLTRKHIDLVMQTYGKFHATSVAMKQQEPEKYQEIVNSLEQNLKHLSKNRLGAKNMKMSIDDAYEILKDELDASMLVKWRSLREKVQTMFQETVNDDAMQVIVHGDSWSNNFMYKYEDADKSTPTEVLILDWQMARTAVLICDLSYFLFCCISEEDINNMDDILNVYYEHFSRHLTQFAIDANTVYPLNQFLDEWKKYCKFGVIFSSMLLRVSSIDKEDVVDISEQFEKEKKSAESFLHEMSYKSKMTFKKRIKYIVEYVVNNDLI